MAFLIIAYKLQQMMVFTNTIRNKSVTLLHTALIMVHLGESSLSKRSFRDHLTAYSDMPGELGIFSAKVWLESYGKHQL